jgi:hypothetical protein
LLVVLLILTIVVTGNPKSTSLENGLLQFISFVFSTAIALAIGYFSAREQGRELVQPHGRKAVRRIVTLGSGIQSFGEILAAERTRMERQAEQSGSVTLSEVETTFTVLASQIDGQLRTVGDAIEDWRDVVPDEVRAIEEQAQRNDSDE